MKIGIFGGTFNPPHKTHVQIAKQAKEQLSLDKLFVVPCGIPPHKSCDVSPDVRLKLTQLAFSDFAEISRYEIDKPGKSYTLETLKYFREQYPEAELYLVIGGDSFRDFGTWYHPEEIAKIATLVVAERKRKTSTATAKRIAENYGAKTMFLDVKPNGVSSTEIRLRYEFGFNNSAFVPQPVDSCILVHGLYCRHKDMVQKVQSYLKPERFMHTFYVVKRGLELATDADDKEKVFLACLLHDCAKYVPESEYKKYGFEKPEDMPVPVVHSFLGQHVANVDFGITDQEILDAIAYHTTGCPNMTRLQKIVYVADKTEQTRPYPMSHLIKGSLNRQLKACLVEANTYTSANHADNIYPLSQQTLDFYCPKRKK